MLRRRRASSCSILDVFSRIGSWSCRTVDTKYAHGTAFGGDLGLQWVLVVRKRLGQIRPLRCLVARGAARVLCKPISCGRLRLLLSVRCSNYPEIGVSTFTAGQVRRQVRPGGE